MTLKNYAALERLPKRLVAKINQITSDPTNYQTVGLWSSAFVAALVAVLYAKLFRWAEAGFHRILDASPYLVFIVSPVLFTLAWLVVRHYAPEAAGSGIPQMMAANEIEYSGTKRLIVDRLLSLRTATVKILSSLLCVLGGGAIGREGPTLQVSSSIFHFFGKQVRRFSPQTDEHTWIVAGAAAGLASAFNTPLGGIVYAIEELGFVHFQRIRTALISAVIVAGLVAQWILGSYLYLGFPKLKAVHFSILPSALLVGVVTGLLGAAFARALLFLINKRHALKKTAHLFAITILCGIVAAALAYIDHRTPGSGTNVIMDILFKGDQATWLDIVTRSLGTLVAYLSGAAGGIFSPSLALGGVIGSYISSFIETGNSNLMVLLGMIGFLTGVTRTPFTSFILVLEMTDRHSAIFPMMLTAVVAQWISQLIDKKSFYEHVKEKYVSQAKVDGDF